MFYEPRHLRNFWYKRNVKEEKIYEPTVYIPVHSDAQYPYPLDPQRFGGLDPEK